MNHRTPLRLALAGVFAAAAGSAFACNYQSLASSPTFYSSFVQSQPECFVGTSPASSQYTVATSFTQLGAISDMATSRLSGVGPAGGQLATLGIQQISGMAAGGKPAAWNLWGNVSQTRAKYDALSTTAFPSRSFTDTDVTNYVVGADYRFSPSLVAGVSVAADRGNGAIKPTGVASVSTNTNGYSISPYVGFQINRNWAVDGALGYGDGEHRAAGGAVTKSDKRFWSANLSFTEWSGNLQYGAKLSYLDAKEKLQDLNILGVTIPGSAADNRIARVQLGGQVGYWVSGGAMPYISAAYLNDSKVKTDIAPYDKSAAQLGVGVNFFSLASGMVGGVAFTKEFARDNTDYYSFVANVSIRF